MESGARIAGAVVAVVLVLLWAWVVLDPRVGGVAVDAGPPLWVAWGIFTVLAGAGGVAALRGAFLLTALAGFISLVPVGIFLLGAPGTLRWIGILDAVLMASGAVGLGASLRGPEGEDVGPD